MERDIEVLSDPTQWPEHPYLRVERRIAPRPPQGTCFVRVTTSNEVQPFVFVVPKWPPAEDVKPIVLTTFGERGIYSLVAQGWRVVAD